MALAEQFERGVLDGLRVAMIGEASREASQVTVTAIQPAEQERAAVGGDVRRIERDRDGPRGKFWKEQWRLGTDCLGSGGGIVGPIWLIHNQIDHAPAAFFIPAVRNPS